MNRDEGLKLKIGDILVFRTIQSMQIQEQTTGENIVGGFTSSMYLLSIDRRRVKIDKYIINNIREGYKYITSTSFSGSTWGISLDMLEKAEDINEQLGNFIN
jgi:hypothetical protein